MNSDRQWKDLLRRRDWLTVIACCSLSGCWAHQPPGRSPAAEADPERAARARAQEAAVEQGSDNLAEEE